MDDPRFISMLRLLQGDESLSEFSQRLGVSVSQLSRVYSGLRRPGLQLVCGAVKQAPELPGEVWGLADAD